MLDNNEYGFIYFLLLENYRDEYIKNMEIQISQLLHQSDLPKEEEIHSLVMAEMEIIMATAKEQRNLKEVLLLKLENGRCMFNKLGIRFQNITIGEAIQGNMPALICNDTNVEMKSYRDSELFSLFPLKALSLSEWYNISAALNQKLTEMYEVRGV